MGAATYDGALVARLIRAMAPDIKAKLGLAPETAERLSALHHGDDFATLEDGQQKLDAYRALQLQVGRMLEASDLERYRALLNVHWEEFAFSKG